MAEGDENRVHVPGGSLPLPRGSHSTRKDLPLNKNWGLKCELCDMEFHDESELGAMELHFSISHPEVSKVHLRTIWKGKGPAPEPREKNREERRRQEQSNRKKGRPRRKMK